MIKRYNETTKKWQTTIKNIECGIVYINNDYIEMGYFAPEQRGMTLCIDGTQFNCINTIEPDEKFIFSNATGYYLLKNTLTETDIAYHTLKKGSGNFPYSFPKRYEAADNFHIFKDKHCVELNNEYALSKLMPYTFGLEFETSMGYIPQDRCFKDGLIPLRDGSITGIEYSTIVLQGNSGLNLLQQQLIDLKQHTYFNKECALHIHMGNYPITEQHIFVLYVLCYVLQSDILHYVPVYTLETSQYKDNGKDYCKPLPSYVNFDNLFKSMTNQPFFNSFTQPHPADLYKEAKWRIAQRYYWVNFINALCYDGAKTIEFRFLRPTFNFRIIYTWLAILSGMLLFCEDVVNEYHLDVCSINFAKIKNIFIQAIRQHDSKVPHHFRLCNTFNLYDVINYAYKDRDPKFAKYLIGEIQRLEIATINQSNNNDKCGRDINIINDLFTPETVM